MWGAGASWQLQAREGHVAAVVCSEPDVVHWGYDKAIFADTIPPRASGRPG